MEPGIYVSEGKKKKKKNRSVPRLFSYFSKDKLIRPFFGMTSSNFCEAELTLLLLFWKRRKQIIRLN
jgi:hypothetical protein